MNIIKYSFLVKNLCIACLVGICLTTSQAAVVIDINQIGADIVASGSGNVNLAGLTLTDGAWAGGWLYPSYPDGGIAVVGAGESVGFYTSVTGPLNLGPGGSSVATFGSGDSFGVIANTGLYLPAGYISGDALSGSSTWANTTFEDLGLTGGTYTWTWGSGPTADSFTVNVNAEAVPEPSSCALMTVTLLFAAGIAVRNHRKMRAESLAGR